MKEVGRGKVGVGSHYLCHKWSKDKGSVWIPGPKGKEQLQKNECVRSRRQKNVGAGSFDIGGTGGSGVLKLCHGDGLQVVERTPLHTGEMDPCFKTRQGGGKIAKKEKGQLSRKCREPNRGSRITAIRGTWGWAGTKQESAKDMRGGDERGIQKKKQSLGGK